MGPGTHLHDLIATWTGQKPSLSCSCADWLARMDKQWGPAGCRKNLNLIVAKLMKEARARAVEWRAVPVDSSGTLLNTLWNRTWKGAFLIPGSGVFLEPFVRQMVLTAIERSEADGWVPG